MKILVLIFLSLYWTLSSFGQSGSNVVLFDKDSKISGFSMSDYKRFTPTANDLIAIDSLAAIFVKNNSSSLTVDKKAINNYHDYYKQVYGLVNNDKERILFINCFCNIAHHDYWKQETVNVKGGGSCYFSFKVNLSDYRFYDFWINAPK